MLLYEAQLAQPVIEFHECQVTWLVVGMQLHNPLIGVDRLGDVIVDGAKLSLSIRALRTGPRRLPQNMAECHGHLSNKAEKMNALYRTLNYDIPRSEFCCRLGSEFVEAGGFTPRYAA